MTPTTCRRVAFAMAACAAISFANIQSASADVNWVINSNTSNVTFAGGTYLGGNPYAFLEQAPGTLVAPLSGYFPTNNSFTTNVIFGGSQTATLPSAPNAPSPGPNYSANYQTYLNDYSNYLTSFASSVKYGTGAPSFPDKVKSPDGSDPNLAADQSLALAKYGQWADTAMVASSAVQGRVVGVNTGSYQPTFDKPSVPLPISPAPPTAGPATPGLLAGLMIDDFSTDPITYTPFVFRDFAQTFFTNTANPTTDPLYPALLPSGAPINLTPTAAYGQFSPAAIGTGLFANWDTYAPDFFGGGLTGHSPVTEYVKNTGLTPGVISRNGSEYVMTFTSIATKFIQGFKLPDGSRDKSQPDSTLDIGTQQTYLVHAVANLSPGDVNFDGVVNIIDVTLMANHWLQSDVALANHGLIAGDANGDGTVNIVDVTMAANNWLHTSPALGGGGSLTAVPEPATLVLGLVAGLGLVCFGRRRACK